MKYVVGLMSQRRNSYRRHTAENLDLSQCQKKEEMTQRRNIIARAVTVSKLAGKSQRRKTLQACMAYTWAIERRRDAYHLTFPLVNLSGRPFWDTQIGYRRSIWIFISCYSLLFITHFMLSLSLRLIFFLPSCPIFHYFSPYYFFLRQKCPILRGESYLYNCCEK